MPRPRQEGGRDGRPGGRGDIEEGAAGGAGGRAAEGSRSDTGEVDAKRESGLFQSFLRHGEGLQLLLSVGHVGVLAAAADTVQTRLRKQQQGFNISDHPMFLALNQSFMEPTVRG